MIDAQLERLIFDEPPPKNEFRPVAIYSRQGDCIEFLLSAESYRAERLDSLVTVYYGRESKDIVGSLIKGLSKHVQDILKRRPGFKIEIQGGRIRLEYLFSERLWESASEPSDVLKVYYKLREAAKEAQAEVKIDPDLVQA